MRVTGSTHAHTHTHRPTLLLPLHLLVACPLAQVGQDLGQLADHNVIGGEGGLGLGGLHTHTHTLTHT